MALVYHGVARRAAKIGRSSADSRHLHGNPAMLLPIHRAILKASNSGAVPALPIVSTESDMSRDAPVPAVKSSMWRTIAVSVLGFSPVGVFSTLMLLQILGVLTH
jgi:hypothetical protein